MIEPPFSLGGVISFASIFKLTLRLAAGALAGALELAFASAH
jgi:hypothetical protein